MRPWIARHLGALFVGGLAVALLMASSATAALVITGKDIKNGSVSTKDIKDGTLRSADLSTKAKSDLKSAPFLGSPCQIPGGSAGTLTMSVDPDGVVTLVCQPPPVSGADGDGDADGFLRSQECNDSKPAVNPAAVEVNGNLYDDDCDGTADDGTSTTDADADGQSIQQGDCDDTNPAVKQGNPDTLGNGLDNNCDGVDGVAS